MTTKAAVYKIDAARLDNHTRMNLISKYNTMDMEDAVTRTTENGCIQHKLELESCYSSSIDRELLELDYQPQIIDQTIPTTTKYNSQCYKYELNLVDDNMGEEFFFKVTRYT
jgi:hypothetical protein